MTENSSGEELKHRLEDGVFKLENGTPLEFGPIAEVLDDFEEIARELEEKLEEGVKTSLPPNIPKKPRGD